MKRSTPPIVAFWSVVLLATAPTFFAASSAIADDSVAARAETTSPADAPPTLQAVAGEAKNNIYHSLQLRPFFAEERQFFQLRGPKWMTVGSSGEASPRSFTHYDIKDAAAVPSATLMLQSLDGKKELGKLVTDRPVAMLSPAQLLTDGKPEPIPDDSNFMIGFEPTTGLKFSLNTKTEAEVETVYVPAHHWHHDDETPIGNETLAYLKIAPPLGTKKPDRPLSFLDDFGLNRIDASSVVGRLIPVRVRVLAERPDRVSN